MTIPPPIPPDLDGVFVGGTTEGYVMNNELLGAVIFCAILGCGFLVLMCKVLDDLAVMRDQIADWARYNREVVLWLEEDDEEPDPDPGEDIPEEVGENVVRIDRKNAA